MKKVSITMISTAIIAVLAYFAAISVTFVPGVAALYPAAAFEAAFGIWFGLWGALASYLGLLISGSISGWFSILTGAVLSLSDFILALAPFLMTKFKLFDPEIKKLRDAITFVFGTLILGSLPGSLLYNYINMQLGVLDGWSSFWVAILGWNLGNFIMLIVIGLPVLKIGTPILYRLEMILNTYLKNDYRIEKLN